MTQPTTWTARTVAEATDLLNAVEQRIESAMRAAHPGDAAARLRAGKEIPLNLRITFDTSAIDQIANERTAFDDQINPLNLPDRA
jgi:hypothetical protein